MTGILEILDRRIPQLHASVARAYGDDAKLFGIDLDPTRFAELRTALDAGPQDGTAAIKFKGLQFIAGPTLERETITVAVSMPGSLLCRPAALQNE